MKPERRFKLLAAVALADGQVCEGEEEVLLRVAERLGLARGLAGAIFHALLTESSESGLHPAVVEPALARELFQDIVDLVLSDGVVSEVERRVVLHLAPTFDVSRQEALRLLDAGGGDR